MSAVAPRQGCPPAPRDHRHWFLATSIWSFSDWSPAIPASGAAERCPSCGWPASNLECGGRAKRRHRLGTGTHLRLVSEPTKQIPTDKAAWRPTAFPPHSTPLLAAHIVNGLNRPIGPVRTEMGCLARFPETPAYVLQRLPTSPSRTKRPQRQPGAGSGRRRGLVMVKAARPSNRLTLARPAEPTYGLALITLNR